jgi:copper chaperone CopZ
MKKIFLTAIAVTLSFASAYSQKVSTNDTIDIQMPRYCCGSMNPTIEKCLVYEKGVKDFSINGEDRYVTIVFNSKKTNQQKLEEALAKVGVETPNCKANEKAIEKLPACCRSSARGESEGCGD